MDPGELEYTEGESCMDWVKSLEGLREPIKKYAGTVLILLVGLLFLLLPSGKKSEPLPPETQPQQTQDLQTQLETILSRVEGAGKVKVLLTQSMSERKLYQTNEDMDTADSSQRVRREAVIITDASREENGLVQQVIAPVYLGAVVLCQGADRPAVKLAIIEAVSNATGLGTHHISVLKMK
jgi:stage III sporulation protein AG